MGNFNQADSDGDGIFISAGGMKAMGRLTVVFHAVEQKYKFGHKGDVDQSGLEIKDEFTRKDESTYNVNLKLKCN